MKLLPVCTGKALSIHMLTLCIDNALAIKFAAGSGDIAALGGSVHLLTTQRKPAVSHL